MITDNYIKDPNGNDVYIGRGPVFTLIFKSLDDFKILSWEGVKVIQEDNKHFLIFNETLEEDLKVEVYEWSEIVDETVTIHNTMSDACDYVKYLMKLKKKEVKEKLKQYLDKGYYCDERY